MIWRHRDLLTWLISLFILSGCLSSCKNPTGVGLDVAPEDQITPYFMDTVSIRAYTVRDDSVQSATFNQTLFGLFRDPLFGQTNVGLAIEIGRPSNFERLFLEAEIDSVVLVLPYSGDYYGDTINSTFALRVKPLDEPFVYNTYTTRKWSVRDEVLGSTSLSRYRYKLGQRSDSVRIFQNFGGKDSLVTVRPQLRIQLDKNFFLNRLNVSVDSALLSTASGFRTQMKGLYMEVNPAASTGMGGLVSFQAIEGVSGIEMTYRQPNGKIGEEAGIDTIRTFFPIYPFSSNLGTYSGLASSVDQTYTAPVHEQLDAKDTEFESIYLHAPVGLRGKIVLPYIDRLKGKGLLINKAELVIYVDQERMDGPFQLPAPRLTLYREDIAGQRQNIPDGAAISVNGGPLDSRSLGFLGFGGWYQAQGQRYIFHLTSYIQDVLQGKINGNELYIAPVSRYDQYIPVLPAVNAGGRAVVGGGNHPNYRMKLNIYYTNTSK